MKSIIVRSFIATVMSSGELHWRRIWSTKQREDACQSNSTRCSDECDRWCWKLFRLYLVTFELSLKLCWWYLVTFELSLKLFLLSLNCFRREHPLHNAHLLGQLSWGKPGWSHLSEGICWQEGDALSREHFWCAGPRLQWHCGLVRGLDGEYPQPALHQIPRCWAVQVWRPHQRQLSFQWGHPQSNSARFGSCFSTLPFMLYLPDFTGPRHARWPEEPRGHGSIHYEYQEKFNKLLDFCIVLWHYGLQEKCSLLMLEFFPEFDRQVVRLISPFLCLFLLLLRAYELDVHLEGTTTTSWAYWRWPTCSCQSSTSSATLRAGSPLTV